MIATGEGFSIEVDVHITGARAGDEVLQPYTRDDFSSVPRSVLELKKFRRIAFAPGEKQTVRLDLTVDDLAFRDIAMQWRVGPSTFTMSTGSSSENTSQ